MEVQNKFDTDDVEAGEPQIQPTDKQQRGICLRPYISEEGAIHLK